MTDKEIIQGLTHQIILIQDPTTEETITITTTTTATMIILPEVIVQTETIITILLAHITQVVMVTAEAEVMEVVEQPEEAIKILV